MSDQSTTYTPAIQWFTGDGFLHGMDAEMREQYLKAHSIPHELLDQLQEAARHSGGQALLKLFTPSGAATWYLSEAERQGDDWILFGVCDLGMGFPEYGYVSLTELTSTQGPLGLPVERDIYWQPRRLDEILVELKGG